MRQCWKLWLCISVLLLPARSAKEEAVADFGEDQQQHHGDVVQEEHHDGAEDESDSQEQHEEQHQGEDAYDHSEFQSDEPDEAEEPVEHDEVWHDEHELQTEEGNDISEELQMSPEQSKGLHSQIDKNRDGKVSMPEILEFSAHTRRAIARRDIEGALSDMDADKDGKVSRKEFFDNQFSSAPPPEKPSPSEGQNVDEHEALLNAQKDLEMKKFKIADHNGDGFLDVKELPAALFPETHDEVLALTAAATIKAKDKDGNGELSHDEIWEVEMVSHAHSMDDQARDEQVAEQSAIFQKLDTDKSGGLNLPEVKSWESGAFHVADSMQHFFEVADEDSDHHLNLHEFQNAQEAVAGSDASSHLMEWTRHHEL